MTRFKPLRDWPERLERMTVEELRQERAFWESRLAWLGHPAAKKETANRIREVQREIDAWETRGLLDNAEPYGARLYAELKRLDIVVKTFNCEAIERLQRANREETIRFFRASDEDVLHQIRTREPEEVVKYIVEKANRARQEVPFPLVFG